MFAEFRHQLIRSRGQIIGWGIGLALYGLMMIGFYGSFAGMEDQFQQIINIYPKEMQAFFGDFEQMMTPDGWLSIEYFSLMPIIIGIFVVLDGSGLLAASEEDGTLDLIAAHPLSRSHLFWGRILAFVVTTILILLAAWGLGLVIPATLFDFPATWLEMLLPFASLFAFLMLFGGLAILLSMIVPSRRMAAMLSGGILVLSYFVSGLGELVDEMKVAADFSPYSYFQSGDAMGGLNWTWALGLLGVALLFTLLAWWRFQRRDIRVAGEGGWSFRPRLRRSASAG